MTQANGILMNRFVPPNGKEIEIDNSYVMLRLHSLNAFYAGTFGKNTTELLVSSRIETPLSAAQGNSEGLQNIHTATQIQKDTPCYLQLGAPLTDWIPAYSANQIRVELHIDVILDSKFRRVLELASKNPLIRTLASIHPYLGIASETSKMIGALLSDLLNEGQREQLAHWTLNLNINEIRNGYYGLFYADSKQELPSALRFSETNRLWNEKGEWLAHNNHAVIEIITQQRLGIGALIQRPWYRLLTNSSADACLPISTRKQKNSVLTEWRNILIQVHKLAREEEQLLPQEVSDAIAVEQQKVSEALDRIKFQSTADGIDSQLTETLRKIFGEDYADDIAQRAKSYARYLEDNETN